MAKTHFYTTGFIHIYKAKPIQTQAQKIHPKFLHLKPVEAPDEGAVHVFDRATDVFEIAYCETIFALFRPLNSIVTRQLAFKDSCSRLVRVGEIKNYRQSLNGLQKRKNQLTKTRRRSSANSAGSSASRPSLNERAKVARARAKTSTRARATSTRARSFLSATTSTGALVSEEVGQPGQARPGHLQTLPSVARFKPQTIIFGCHIRVCAKRTFGKALKWSGQDL